jgi:hypothetical protein
MTNRNLGLLVPPENPDHDVHIWATVTQASPLRIKLDGETTALPFTPLKTIAAPALNDRVLVVLMANASPTSRSRRVVIIGKAQ